jgi:hypothetical protein
MKHKIKAPQRKKGLPDFVNKSRDVINVCIYINVHVEFRVLELQVGLLVLGLRTQYSALAKQVVFSSRHV